MKKTIHLVLLVSVSLTFFLSACTQAPALPLPSVPPTFTPEPTAIIKETQPALSENSIHFLYRNISFITPSSLSNKIIAEELDLVAQTGPADSPPTYIQIQIREGWDRGYEDDIPSLVLMYPVADLSREYEEGAETIHNLQALLQDRPSTLPAELPFWPLVYFTQVIGAPLESYGRPVFTAHAQYLDFQSGHGVRYLTFLESEPPRSARMQGLIYTYQGLTNDQRYYVSVMIPVSVRGYSFEAELESLARQNPPDYPSIKDTLKSLNSEQFYHTLGDCDNIIASLTVTP